jgi:hypothetical protein
VTELVRRKRRLVFETPYRIRGRANHGMKKGLPPQPKLRNVMRTKSRNSQRRFVHPMSLNPYLYFDGQCEEAFKFYEKRLGGKITFMMKWEGASMAGQASPGGRKGRGPV